MIGLVQIISTYHNLRRYILTDIDRIALLEVQDIQFLNNISKAIKEYNPYGRPTNNPNENHTIKIHVK
jgi:hypothetical protein